MDDEDIVTVDLALSAASNNTMTTLSSSIGGSGSGRGDTSRLPACTEEMFGGVGSFFYLQCVIGVLILVANFTVLVILIPKRPKCNQDFYLLNLLLAETLIYLVYYPLYLYNEFRGCWDLPYWLCLWKTFCARVFMSASAFAVCLIAYDRYLILQLGIRYDEYENTYKVWLRIGVFWLVVSLLFGGLTAADIALGGVAFDAASQIGYCPAFYSVGPFPEVPTKLLMHCGPVVLCLLIYLLVLCRLIQRKNWNNNASPQQQPLSPAPFTHQLSADSANNKNYNSVSGGSLKLLPHERQFSAAGHHHQRSHAAHYRNHHHHHSDPTVEDSTNQIREFPSHPSSNDPTLKMNNAPDLLLSSIGSSVGARPQQTLSADSSQQQLLPLTTVNSAELINVENQPPTFSALASRRSSPHPQRLYLTTNSPFSASAQKDLLSSSRSSAENHDVYLSTENEGEISSASSEKSSRRPSTVAMHQQSPRALPVRSLFWRMLGRKKRKNDEQVIKPELSTGDVPQSSCRPSSRTYRANIEPDSVSDFGPIHYDTKNTLSAASTTLFASGSTPNHQPPTSTTSTAALCIVPHPLGRQNSTRSLRDMSRKVGRKLLLTQHSSSSQAGATAALLPTLSSSTGSSIIKTGQKKGTASSIHRTRRRAMLKRASKTVLCITVAFFICWIPEAVLSVLMMSCFDYADNPLLTCNLEGIWFGKQVSLLLVCINAFVNPIIYTLTMPDVKRRTARALRRSVLFRYCCGQKSSRKHNALSVSRDENSGNTRSLNAPRTTHTHVTNGGVVTSSC